MADINNVTSRMDDGSMRSSFVEVTGQSSIITAATCSSTIREVLDVDTRFETAMPPIHEEPPYSTPDDAFTELCATCLHSHGTRKEATHFCPGCDRRGRYMCGNCLKGHSVWCNKPEHEVQSLSVDRHSETRYITIEQYEQGRPNCRPSGNSVPTDNDYVNSPAAPLQSNTKREHVRSWLIHNSTDNDSETSEGTITQSKGNGSNLNDHHDASSFNMSMFDYQSFKETETLYQRPKTSISVSQLLEGQYEEIAPRNQEATSHIYCDPSELTRFPRIPNPHRRYLHDPNDWEHMSTATTRRLNDVYNEHNTHERLVALAGGHENVERTDKKKKACVIQ